MAHECVILDLNPRLAAKREALDGTERDRIEAMRLEREWLNANTLPIMLGDAGDLIALNRWLNLSSD